MVNILTARASLPIRSKRKITGFTGQVTVQTMVTCHCLPDCWDRIESLPLRSFLWRAASLGWRMILASKKTVHQPTTNHTKPNMATIPIHVLVSLLPRQGPRWRPPHPRSSPRPSSGGASIHMAVTATGHPRCSDHVNPRLQVLIHSHIDPSWVDVLQKALGRNSAASHQCSLSTTRL